MDKEKRKIVEEEFEMGWYHHAKEELHSDAKDYKLARKFYLSRAERDDLLMEGLNQIKRIAIELCNYTKFHKYPEEYTPEFTELTAIIDRFDTVLRKEAK